jgi:hypothetical protein
LQHEIYFIFQQVSLGGPVGRVVTQLVFHGMFAPVWQGGTASKTQKRREPAFIPTMT